MTDHVALVREAFPSWKVLPAPNPQGSARCKVPAARRQLALKRLYLSNGRRGAYEVTIYGAAYAYPTPAAARLVLHQLASKRTYACDLADAVRTYRAERRGPVTVHGSDLLPPWLHAPAALHVAGWTIETRAAPRPLRRGYARISNSYYSYEDARDPTVIYAFALTALDREVPREVVEKLLAVASR